MQAAEVVCELYATLGTSFLPKLKGEFAFVCFDSQKVRQSLMLTSIAHTPCHLFCSFLESLHTCSCASWPQGRQQEVSVSGKLVDQMLVCALAVVTVSPQAPTASLTSSQASSNTAGMLSLSALLWQCHRALPQLLLQLPSRL